MNKLLAFSLALVLLASCNGQGSIKTPENAEELLAADIKRSDSLAKSSIAFNLDEVQAGVRYPELRLVDKSNPPVTLNIPAAQATEKQLTLSSLFKSVRYVVLDYGKDSSLGGFNAKVMAAGDGYVTSSLLGLCYFDSEGKLKKVVSKNEAGLIPVRSGYAFNVDGLVGVMPNASVKGDRIIYTTVDVPKKEAMVKVFDTKLMVTSLSAPREISNLMSFIRSSSTLVTDNSWIEYYANIYPMSKHTMCVYGAKGDTLAAFRNRLKGVGQDVNTYGDPDSWFRYTYNGELTLRQPYTDTVFRFQYPNVLKPCYVLNFGKEMIDVKSAVLNKTNGKYIPAFWFETDGYIVMGYTNNSNSFNNRKDNKVKYYYAAYDKTTKALFHLALSAKYSEDAYISNDINGGIPLNLGAVDVNNAKGIVLLSKDQLIKIATDKSTIYLPKTNRDAAAKLAAGLKSGQKLVAIYE